MANREPAYRVVGEERDLLDLVPGDRVEVTSSGRSLGHLVYWKRELFETGSPRPDPSLHANDTLSFVKIPDEYDPQLDDATFTVYASTLRTTSYGGSITFSHLHINLTRVFPEDEGEHAEVKELVDMLQS